MHFSNRKVVVVNELKDILMNAIDLLRFITCSYLLSYVSLYHRERYCRKVN